MQMTFLVEMRFLIESLVARCYKGHVSRRVLGKMGIILWSLETYRYIGSKTKSYQIQRGFLLLFIFLSYPSDWAFQEIPSSRVFRPTPVLLIPRFHLMGNAISLHLIFNVMQHKAAPIVLSPGS